jgi:hypothetical protein
MLSGVFQLEFLQPEREWFGGGEAWAIDRPWGAICVRWYDAVGGLLPPKMLDDFLYDHDFLTGKTKKQAINFSMPIPQEARAFSVQYGSSECITRKVPVPPRR